MVKILVHAVLCVKVLFVPRRFAPHAVLGRTKELVCDKDTKETDKQLGSLSAA